MRGGKRKGAGRPPAPTGTKRHNLMLPPDVWNYLNRDNRPSTEITRLARKELAMFDPLPTIVSTTTNGAWTHKISIPCNAPDMLAAADKALAYVEDFPSGKTYTDNGDASAWASFSQLTGIY